MHLGHVGKFHEAVRGEHVVGGRLAEPLEAAALHLVAEQALVADVDEILRLHFHLGLGQLVANHVVEHEDVRVRRRRGLLEAAVGHLENSIHALHHLAEGARINFHEQIIRTVDGPGGNLNVFAEIFIEAAVEHCLEALAIGLHAHAALHRISQFRAERLERQRMVAGLDGFQREINPGDLLRANLQRLRLVIEQLEPAALLYLQLHRLRLVQIVVNGNRHAHLIVLGQGHGEIDVHKEILKDTNAGGRRAQFAGPRHRAHRQPPRGDGISQRHLELGPAVIVRDQLRLP